MVSSLEYLLESIDGDKITFNQENKDLFKKINFIYDSGKSFVRVLGFKNTSLFEDSGFKTEISKDEFYYYIMTKLLCKTFDFFYEIMKDNNKTELELLQREVTLYRDQVEFIKKQNKNK